MGPTPVVGRFPRRGLNARPKLMTYKLTSSKLTTCKLDARSTTTSLNLKGLGEMSLLPVTRMGDPVLRIVAAPIVDPTDPAIAALAQSMMETMVDAPGVGLAAPQVGQSLRLIVMRLIAERGAVDEPLRMMALINPELEAI